VTRLPATAAGLALGDALRQLRRQRGLSQRDLLLPLRLASHSAIVDYESGRRIPPADILAAYERYFGVTDETLRRLRGQALTERAGDPIPRADDAITRLGPTAASANVADLAVPWQLPSPPTHFTGRTRDLSALTAAAHAVAHAGGPVVISAIAGMGGVGKTSLAVVWAHRSRDQFPDGALYVDLRGFHPTGPPLTAAEALTRFLATLGVPADRMPVSPDELSVRYRTLLADRRMVVLLDNARSAEQVRPLLPGVSGCLVVVTSRNRLAGLIARDGARPLPLDVLSPDEAIELLRRTVGTDRADREPNAVAALAQRCGRHPLALRVAAERTGVWPDASLADLVAELDDSSRRLSVLTVPGDECSGVGAVFQWSYEVLRPTLRQFFRTLGLHPGPDLEPYAVAALTDTTVLLAQSQLAELAAAHLLEPNTSPGRYRFHDLLRIYAAGRCVDEDDDRYRLCAVRRLCGWYLHSAVAARVALSPSLPTMRPEPVALDQAPMSFDRHAAALAWCETERANLVAATVLAEAEGLHRLAWQLPTALYGFFERRSHYRDWTATHTVGLRAARAAGDREAEGRILCNLGNAWRPMYRIDDAVDCYERAQEIFAEVGYRQGEAKVLGNLGLCYDMLGRPDAAEGAHGQAVALFRELHDRYGEALTLTNVGQLLARLGRTDEAMADHWRALELFRDIADRHGEGQALANLAQALATAGRGPEALCYHEQALDVFRELGDRFEEAAALAALADTQDALADPEAATVSRRRALVRYEEIGDERACARLLDAPSRSA
jgi:tetratricopeptide (TPR) repeat protein/transcriptional regulator with XRE-family HTH domain